MKRNGENQPPAGQQNPRQLGQGALQGFNILKFILRDGEMAGGAFRRQMRLAAGEVKAGKLCERGRAGLPGEGEVSRGAEQEGFHPAHEPAGLGQVQDRALAVVQAVRTSAFLLFTPIGHAPAIAQAFAIYRRVEAGGAEASGAGAGALENFVARGEGQLVEVAVIEA